jgi:hypothetical protein
MALTHSEYVRGGERVPASQWAGDVVAVRYEFPYVGANYADGDIVELGILPAHHTVRDMIIDSELVDSGSDFEVDVGLMSGEVGEALDEEGSARTCGAEFFSGATTGQTAGTGRMSLGTGFAVAPTDKDRSIGVKLVDQGAGEGGTWALTVLYST